VTEVGHEFGAEGDVHSGHGGQAAGHFGGAVREAGAVAVGVSAGLGVEALLFAQTVQVAHGQLKDIGLLQLGDVFALGLQSGHHQLLELVQAPIDACAAFAFKHWFHNLITNKEKRNLVNVSIEIQISEAKNGVARKLIFEGFQNLSSPFCIGRCGRWAAAPNRAT